MKKKLKTCNPTNQPVITDDDIFSPVIKKILLFYLIILIIEGVHSKASNFTKKKNTRVYIAGCPVAISLSWISFLKTVEIRKK